MTATAFDKDKLRELLKEDIRLSLRENTPEKRARRAHLREEIDSLLYAGLDENPSRRPFRPNPHDE